MKQYFTAVLEFDEPGGISLNNAHAWLHSLLASHNVVVAEIHDDNILGETPRR